MPKLSFVPYCTGKERVDYLVRVAGDGECFRDGPEGKVQAAATRAAVLQERDRLARDVHDTVAQGFTGIVVQLEAAEDALQRGDFVEAGVHVRRAGDLARQSLAETRRSVQALRPKVLESHGLGAALERLIQQVTSGSPLRAEYRCEGEPYGLTPAIEEGLLRVGQEALTNTLKHAHASHFSARLVFGAAMVQLEIADNGCGFDPAGSFGGFGLMGMHERVTQLGGQLSLESGPDRGTTVRVTLPVPDAVHQ